MTDIRIKPWISRIFSKTLNVAIVGNCQARPLGFYMKMIEPRIKLSPPVIVHLAKPEDEASVTQQLIEADLIFAQLVGDNYQPNFVTTNRLLAEYPGKTIPWINLYYRGYNPELQYWRDYKGDSAENPLLEYHITSIIEGIREELSENAILNRLRDKEWNDERYKGVADTSFNELKLREVKTPVSITDFIETRLRQERLFFTFNHPNANLLYEYARRLLAHVGHDKRSAERPNKLPEFLNKIIPPVNPCFDVAFPNTGRKIEIKHGGGKFGDHHQELSERELVDCFQTLYKTLI